MLLQDQFEQCPQQLAFFGPLELALVCREQEVRHAWRVLRLEALKCRAMVTHPHA
jgi:hypothetical protein